MTDPPASRPPVGSLAWARLTHGNLTSAERRHLLSPILQTAVRYAAGRLRMALGLRSARTVALDLDRLRWPDSALARATEAACHTQLSTALVNHSYRTFVFALALTTLDGVAVDYELLYASALVHDIALEQPVAQHCFAARGAEEAHQVAVAAGADADTAARLAEIVVGHVTAGDGVGLDPLAPVLAAGALVDILGLRLWDYDPVLVQQLLQRYPRVGFKREIARCWRREAAAVPAGRAAAIERVALFSTVAQFAPFAD